MAYCVLSGTQSTFTGRVVDQIVGKGAHLADEEDDVRDGSNHGEAKGNRIGVDERAQGE
jgi:hypothetical protein